MKELNQPFDHSLIQKDSRIKEKKIQVITCNTDRESIVPYTPSTSVPGERLIEQTFTLPAHQVELKTKVQSAQQHSSLETELVRTSELLIKFEKKLLKESKVKQINTLVDSHNRSSSEETSDKLKTDTHIEIQELSERQISLKEIAKIYHIYNQSCDMELNLRLSLLLEDQAGYLRQVPILTGLKQFEMDIRRSGTDGVYCLIAGQPLPHGFAAELTRFYEEFSQLQNKSAELLIEKIKKNESIFEFLNAKLSAEVTIQLLTYFHQAFFYQGMRAVHSQQRYLIEVLSERGMDIPKGKYVLNIDQRNNKLFISAFSFNFKICDEAEPENLLKRKNFLGEPNFMLHIESFLEGGKEELTQKLKTNSKQFCILAYKVFCYERLKQLILQLDQDTVLRMVNPTTFNLIQAYDCLVKVPSADEDILKNLKEINSLSVDVYEIDKYFSTLFCQIKCFRSSINDRYKELKTFNSNLDLKLKHLIEAYKSIWHILDEFPLPSKQDIEQGLQTILKNNNEFLDQFVLYTHYQILADKCQITLPPCLYPKRYIDPRRNYDSLRELIGIADCMDRDGSKILVQGKPVPREYMMELINLNNELQQKHVDKKEKDQQISDMIESNKEAFKFFNRQLSIPITQQFFNYINMRLFLDPIMHLKFCLSDTPEPSILPKAKYLTINVTKNAGNLLIQTLANGLTFPGDKKSKLVADIKPNLRDPNISLLVNFKKMHGNPKLIECLFTNSVALAAEFFLTFCNNRLKQIEYEKPALKFFDDIKVRNTEMDKFLLEAYKSILQNPPSEEQLLFLFKIMDNLSDREELIDRFLLASLYVKTNLDRLINVLEPIKISTAPEDLNIWLDWQEIMEFLDKMPIQFKNSDFCEENLMKLSLNDLKRINDKLIGYYDILSLETFEDDCSPGSRRKSI